MVRSQITLGCLVTVLLGGFAALIPAEETARIVIPGESRSTGAKLEEARQRIAEKKWGEAIGLLQSVVDSAGSDLAAVDRERSVSARRLAHAILARSGPECLRLYRKRIEVQARRWLEAASEGDDRAYRRLVEEAFCSVEALTALNHLGDQAFERGRFEEAETCWQLAAPLEKTDPKKAPADLLVHPDPPPDLVARLRAKQLLARLHRDAPHWKDQVAAYRKAHPKAAGALAGRKGLYGDILHECAGERQKLPPRAQKSNWQAFGGDSARGLVAIAPKRLPDHLGQLCRGGPTWRFDLSKRRLLRQALAEVPDQTPIDAARRLAFYPVVVDHTALVSDGQYITAYDLSSGKAKTWYDAASVIGGMRPGQGFAPVVGLPGPADLRHTLTVAEGCVFARLGTQTIHDVRAEPGPGRTAAGESVLVCLSLQPMADGERKRWLVRARDPGRKEFAVFEGAPVVIAGRVYVAATRFVGDKVVTAVHCYPVDPEDSVAPLLWKTDICESRELLPASANDADGSKKQRARHQLLTAAGPNVVYCSHSGAIVALDRRTGKRSWAVRYPQRDDSDTQDEPVLQDLAPCLFAGGKVYAAPHDSDRLLCLDPQTGETIWQRDGLGVVHLLGVGSGRLIFSTWNVARQGQAAAGGLRAVDADDGGDGPGWSLPDDGGGLLPFGRGLLVGDLVLWPTARRPYGVFAVRQEDGEQPDNPALLYRIPSGNLVYANGCLLVTDQRTMWAFVPQEILPDEERPGSVRRPGKRARDRQLTPSQELLERVTAGRWRDILARPDLAQRTIVDQSGTPRLAAAVACGELIARKQHSVSREKLIGDFLEQTESRFPHAIGDVVGLYPDSRRVRQLLHKHANDEETCAAAWLRLLSISRGDERTEALYRLGLLWQKAGHTTAARVIFQQLQAEPGDRLVAAIDPQVPVRDLARQQLSGRNDEGQDRLPVLRLPLQVAEWTLDAGEVLPGELQAEGSAPKYLWTVKQGSLRCRDRADGRICWSRQLSMVEPWAKRLGTILLLGDRRSVQAVDARSGQRLWQRQAPGPATYLQGRTGEYHVPAESSHGTFGRAVLIATRLVVVANERTLLALDALTGDGLWRRSAPGAACEMPFPRGCVVTLAPAGVDRLIAQVSGHRWLLDSISGKVVQSSPTTLTAWKRLPVPLGAGALAVVEDSRRIEVIDPGSGKRLWVRQLSDHTLLSGEPPLVVAAGRRVVVVEPLNIGLRVVCLDRATGKEVWPEPVVLPGAASFPGAWAAADEVLYHGAEGVLFARSLRDGKVLWQRPWNDAERVRLIPAGGTLVVVAAGLGWRFQFRSPFGSLQWVGGTAPEPPGAVNCLDTTSGETVQIIHPEITALPCGHWFRPESKSVFPSWSLRSDPEAPALEVRLGGELLVAVGNRVKILRPRATPPQK